MNSDMLRRYRALVEFLGSALGPDYEIALHDLSCAKPAIVAIANGHVSGRTVGAPLTNVAMQIIADRSYETENCKLNYRGVSAAGHALRCSTFFIKDDKGRLAGLLCINFDDSRYQELASRVLGLAHPEQMAQTPFAAPPANDSAAEPTETFFNSIAAATEDALSSVLDRSVPPQRLTQEEKMEIVGVLEQRGIFLLKGAVNEVAQQLACSPASIYRYLSKLNRERRTQKP
ncbi:MAG: PAS domain-containing protein [Pygmaiobacter massiliensis]|nr:PAS domain-containing protein [Pygmaiobacter massiliensis]